MGGCVSSEAGGHAELHHGAQAVGRIGSANKGSRVGRMHSGAPLQGSVLIQQVKTVLASLSAIPATGNAATCNQAAQLLQQHLDGVATASISTHTCSTPSVCVLAGAAGAGSHLLQQQLVMSGSSWAPCLCCMQLGTSFLYKTVHSEEDAKSLPQDWSALYHQAGLRTFLACHISVAGQNSPVGVLSLASASPDAFMDESWGLLLAMIGTGLVPLLTSPWLSGLSRLAASLMDAAGEEFSAFASAFLQGSTQLLEATTHRQLGVRLGLLSADGQEVLLLHHNGASSRLPAHCDDSCYEGKRHVHTFGSFASIYVSEQQLHSTRLAAAHTLLREALHSKQEAFVADARSCLDDQESAPLDMVDIGDELAASMVVVPLFGANSKPIGGLYVTASQPGSLLQASPVVHEQASMLQHMLQQQVVKLPTDWEELSPSLSPSGSMSSGCSSPVGPSTPSASLPHSAKLAVLQEVWQMQDKQQKCATVYLQELELHSVLGKGGFSTVYAGTWQGCRTAIKVMHVATNDKLGIPIKSAMEMATLSTLKHPNIVVIYACLTDMVEDRTPHRNTSSASSAPYRQPLNMRFRKQCPADLTDAARDHHNIVVMERCDRGNLWQAVRQEGLLHKQLPDGRLKINMRLVYTVLLNVAHGLKYLHSLGLVHCDIKADNVLLQTSNGCSNGFVCKLGDFGLVKMLGEKASRTNKDTGGTLTHLAPERFQIGSLVTPAVDTFSFGILMYELYAGQRPYKGLEPGPGLAKAIVQGLRPQFPSSTPPAYRAMAEACWSHSIADRPGFDAIVQQLQAHLGTSSGQR